MLDSLDRALILPFQWISDRIFWWTDITCYRLAAHTAFPLFLAAAFTVFVANPMTSIALEMVFAGLMFLKARWRWADGNFADRHYWSGSRTLPRLATSGRFARLWYFAGVLFFLATVPISTNLLELAGCTISFLATFVGAALLGCTPNPPSRNMREVIQGA